MITAGLHDNLDERTYHADRDTLSHSGAKLLLKAPAHYRHELDHPKHSDAFDFGTAAHKLVLGVGAELVIFDYDPDKVKSPKSTKAWKEQQADCRARGAVLLTPAEFATVHAMADKLSEHTMAMRLLSEGRPEVSAYAQDPDTGVWMRGRCDWLGERVISDYKTTRSSEPDAFLRSAISLGYIMQHPWYLDLFAACGHPAEAFAFIAQEYDPPYIVTVIELPGDLVDRGRAKYRRALEIFRDCTAANVWPGYIADDTFAQPSAPLWALRDEDAA